ncbi:MAG: lysophospholipid acyltransferase family protein [Mesosutterella sp.]|nr:lysophospholipid acyltransferase family protein [Mesosutterella sp.]
MDKFYFYTAKLCIRLLCLLSGTSVRTRAALGKLLGNVLWLAVPKRRHIALTNLKLCMPELSEKQRRDLALRTYQNAGRAALDHAVLWKGSREEVQRLVRFEGLELVTDPTNRPLIVVSPHFLGLEAAGIAFNTYVRGVSLYQKQANAAWDEACLKGRLRFSNPVLIPKSGHSDLRPVIRAMRQGLPFYYLPDMDHGRKNSVFVPFFGVQAATIPMVSRLARLTGAAGLWCVAEMTAEGYTVHLKRMEEFPTRDYVADTARINRELEGWIRRFPDQYLWTHRRFKTRPEGEPSVY